jgi:hypothetical protein
MTDTPITGQCHCGAVRITIPRMPASITECNCSLCYALGGRWCYFGPSDVIIEAAPDATTAYVRTDLNETYLATHHCRTCGTITHWLPLPGRDLDRIGVNVRLFAEDVAAGMKVTKVDGRSW